MKINKYTHIERSRFIKIYLFLLPTIALFAMFYLMPIITVLFTSFTKWDGFSSPQFNGIKNYLRLFRQGSFLISLRNLLNWSLIAMVGHVGFGVMIAFFLFQKPIGWKVVRSTFMIPNVISAAAWAMIYKFIFNNEFGVLNSLIREIIPNFSVNWFYQSPAAFWAITFTWLFYAVIVTMLVLGDLMAIPKETLEAAKIDGASGMQLTRYIKLPLCRNSIGTSVILSVTSRIAMYENIALTTRGGPGDDTMGLSLILVNNITDYNYGMANATAMVMFIIGILTLLVINRLFRMNEPV
ncbi:MAG: sugar ABC transporter permease [Eubacteriales bacterium]|nr:sugar ABC transporter permease [Eubacteriales bacterium]